MGPSLTVAAARPAVTPADGGPSASGTPVADVEAGAATADRTGDDAAVGRLVAAIAELIDASEACGGADRWSVPDRRRALAGLDRAGDVIGVARGRVLVAEEAAGAWADSGERSFAAWRGKESGLGERAAGAQQRLADGLSRLPRVEQAVADGAMSMAHAEALAGLVSGAPSARREAVAEALGDPAAQQHFVELAGTVDAGDFATSTQRWAATVDPVRVERDHAAARANRFLSLSEADGGVRVKGFLDRVAGRRLRLALEAVTPRPAKDDERSSGQRAADALETLAVGALSDTETKPGAHVPPQVTLMLTEQTWLALRAGLRSEQRAAEQQAADGDTLADAMPGVVDAASVATAADPEQDRSLPHPPAEWEDGTPVPGSVLARLLCDCELTRVVMGAESVPLDLGRAVRVYSREQRRAVIARDRGCAWSGCTMQARWCEVHHLDWWHRDGGSTAVDRGVLLCSFHHHQTHQRDLTITRMGTRPDGAARYEFRQPDGRVLGGPPSHADDGGPPDQLYDEEATPRDLLGGDNGFVFGEDLPECPG